METKQKTPVEKLKDWADLLGFNNGNLQIIIGELEAAELYASEENRKKDDSKKVWDELEKAGLDIRLTSWNDEPKQSSPVSLEVENLKTLVYGKELNTYQKGLAIQEFEKMQSQQQYINAELKQEIDFLLADHQMHINVMNENIELKKEIQDVWQQHHSYCEHTAIEIKDLKKQNEELFDKLETANILSDARDMALNKLRQQKDELVEMLKNNRDALLSAKRWCDKDTNTFVSKSIVETTELISKHESTT